jgi:hypothetical protein
MGDPGHEHRAQGMCPPRYTKRPLPAYRHVPGRTPHPLRDPEGHSFELPPTALPNLNAADWRTCEHFLYGIDLFNLGYWWECHEVLEGLWHAAGIGTSAAHALQAVIQCAAAHLKATGDCPRGAMRLHEHSLRHARWSGRQKLGLDLDELVMNTRTFLTVANSAPAAISLEFRLRGAGIKKGKT